MATEDELAADLLVEAVKDRIAKGLDPLAARIKALEERDPVTELKTYTDTKIAQAIAGLPAPERGEKGDVGDRGEKGEAGEQGIPGKDGESVSLEQVQALVEKAVSEIEIVVPPAEKGDPGEKGANGRDGVDGKDGASGKDGKDGEPGPKGDAGETGQKGLDGEPGRDGRDGERGPAGKDAAELVIASAIDPERIYACGTWARYRGGLVRATRDTDPLAGGDLHAAGWAVMVEGVADVAIVPVDEHGRKFVVEMLLTGGRKSTLEVKTAIPVDRGVWKEGEAYDRGDGVSLNGCWWIAQKETSDRPGTSPAWRMAVKAGRDGKDLRPDGPKTPREPLRLS